MMLINQANMSDESWFAFINEVHDQYFDLNEVKFEPQIMELRLSVGGSRKGPFNEKELVIKGVDSVAVEDEARIQYYMLLDMSVNDKKNELTILATGLEIRIGIRPGWEIAIGAVNRKGGDQKEKG